MSRFYTLLVSLILLNLSLFGQQFENLIVEKIEVYGLVPEGMDFETETVKSHIKTSEGDFFSQTTFDSDLKILAVEFDRVEPYFEVIDNKLVIKLKVWPKPMIRSINWSGNLGLDHRDLQKELGVNICTVFDRIGFNKAFHKLKGYYVKKGFFEAELSYEVVFDPITNEVDITVCIVEGRSGKISRIIFNNFCPDEEDEILDMMVTKKFVLFTSWLSGEGLYNEDAIQYDQSQIINYLQNKGFADANVTIEAIDSPLFFERIHLHITAERGEVYTIGKITFDGHSVFSDEEIAQCFVMKEGTIFSPDRINASTKRIESLYGSKGYIDAAINFEPKLEIDCGNVYSIHVTIDEGEAFRVGIVKVLGNCTTQTNVILHETLLTPGELFNTNKLDFTEQRLKNIGYFENVNVYAVRTEEGSCLEGNYRDVHIEVEEKQTGRFGTFFGYSSVESVFGGINITEKNFNSAGLGSIFSKTGPGLRGGGEYLSATVQVGQKSRTYGLSWTRPYFMDSRWSVGFDINKSSNRYISDDYDLNSMGYNLRATYEINAFTRFGWHYRISNTNVTVGHNAVLDRQLRMAADLQGLISASGITLGYDSTDSFEFPTKGIRSMFEFEYAGLGGAHTFFSMAYLNSFYMPLTFTNQTIFKLRYDFRFIQPLWKTDYNHIPLDERLFLGGDNIMRGFKSYKLGPLFDDSHDPAGGVSMQIYSAEIIHNFNRRASVFVFFDAGALSKNQWEFNYLYQSAGVGARLKILEQFPPITFGLGFPLVGDRKIRKNFFINFGGTF